MSHPTSEKILNLKVVHTSPLHIVSQMEPLSMAAHSITKLYKVKKFEFNLFLVLGKYCIPDTSALKKIANSSV
jgi:hypothetical protein